MPRIHELIADELAQLDEQARQIEAKAGQVAAAGAAAGSAASAGSAQAPGSGAGSAQDPRQAEAQKQAQGQAQAQIDQARQQLEQARQQMTRAEELRGQAQTALAALDKALTGNADPMPPAKQADTALTELRKLFFSVIEHLQELIREQGETRDQTSAASGEDDFTRGPKLPGLIGRQDGHGQMAKAITEALAQQADAAAKQPAQGPQQGPNPKSLAAAADEVRQSQGDMDDARANLVKARDNKTATESLAPGVKSQGKALEHLENALKLLQPPQKKNQNDRGPAAADSSSRSSSSRSSRSPSRAAPASAPATRTPGGSASAAIATPRPTRWRRTGDGGPQTRREAGTDAQGGAVDRARRRADRGRRHRARRPAARRVPARRPRHAARRRAVSRSTS